MRTKYLLLPFITLFILGACSSEAPKKTEPVILAYAMNRGEVPDPTHITHINYSFGHVNETFNGVMINRPARPDAPVSADPRPTSEDRLRAIVELKQQKPSLKVLLAIGGWGSGRFSEMAADLDNRRAFVADCKRVVDEFGLDGIDMDWEYPTSSSAGISSLPEDTDNFTALMRELREILGNDKLLTFASAANAKYVDFKAVEPYVDFVNVMTYDMGMPPYHHSALYPSEHTTLSAEEAVDLHIAAGIPPEKLVLGIPFYGKGLPGINIHNIAAHTDYTELWDDAAKVPYLVNADREFVHTYENTRSIALKCDFIKERGLLGGMYWQYSSDDSVGTFRKAVYYGVTGKTP
jgi:chitinase